MIEHERILATFDAYAEAYCAQDLEGVMAVFEAGDAVSVIGPGEADVCAGRAAVTALFEREFEALRVSRIEWVWRNVLANQDYAVVAARLTHHVETVVGPKAAPMRWSVAMTKRDGAWRWLHRHASLAAPQARIDDVQGGQDAQDARDAETA